MENDLYFLWEFLFKQNFEENIFGRGIILKYQNFDSQHFEQFWRMKIKSIDQKLLGSRNKKIHVFKNFLAHNPFDITANWACGNVNIAVQRASEAN